MAVEIPVVIDIDKAFQDAAKNVPGAMKPLKDSINALSSDLELFRDKLNSATPMSKNFEIAAKNCAKLEQAIDLVNSKINQFTTNGGSVRRLSGDLAVIQQQFERMGAQQMFDASGALSADAKKLQQDYAKVATELDKVYSILTAEYEAQKKNREETERQAQAEREHQAALTMTANSMNDLNTKLAAWRKELASLDATNPKWGVAAQNVATLSARVQELNVQIRRLGTESGSIDRLNVEIQELNRQWNAMGSSDKFVPGTNRLTAEAQQLVRNYLAAETQLERQLKSLSQIAQEQKRIEQAIQNATSKRQYEELVLKSTANTMHRLSEQARILSERLNNAKFGTKRYDELKTKLEEVRRKMHEVQGSTGAVTTEMKKQSLVLQNITSIASMYFSVFGAMRFIKNIRETTAEFEMQRVALGGIIQDANKAESLFKEIKAAAIKSPFQIKELVTYTKQLSAYRIESDKLFEVTTKLADVSAGLGVDMNRLVLAYGQVKAASVLRGQELRQFTEAGIPLVDLLAKKFQELGREGTTTADVFELISKRAVPFEMVAEIFDDMTEKGGIFYKMQEKQAETLAGQWANLKDALSIMYDEIGNTSSVHAAMEGLISDAKFLFNNWRIIGGVLKSVAIQYGAVKLASIFIPTLTKNTALAAKAAAAKARATQLEAANEARANIFRKIAISQLNAYSKHMNAAASASTLLGRGLHKGIAGFLGGGWIGIATTAVTVLVGWLISARKEAERLGNELSKNIMSGKLQADQSVRNFERLADTAVMAAHGSAEQRDALKELQRTYGDIIPSQDLQIKKLQDLKGNYDSLTQAIRDKIEVQTHEQNVNQITDTFASSLGQQRKGLESFLKKEEGYSTEEATRIISGVEKAIKDGLLTIETDFFEAAKIINKIAEEQVNRAPLPDFGQAFQIQSSLFSFKSYYEKLIESTSRYNKAIKDESDRFAALSNELGAYADKMKEIRNATSKTPVGFTLEQAGTFEFREARWKQAVERYKHELQTAFGEIDISNAFDVEDFIDFDKIFKKVSSSQGTLGLKGFVTEIQKDYLKLAPQESSTRLITEGAKRIADEIGISMSDIQGYLKEDGKAMEEYAKSVDEFTKAQKNKIKELKWEQENYREGLSNFIRPTDEDIAKEQKEADFLDKLLEFVKQFLKSTSKGKNGYTQDPFIKQMQERVKFMQDFKKGYDDLNKYLSSQAALTEQDSIMRNRGLSLGLAPEEQMKAAKNLSSWYQEAMNKAFSEAKRFGASGTIESFLSQQINDTSNKGKALKDFQSLIQSLWDAKTDFDTSQKKKTFEDALKKLADEIKRSETARNFYNDILDLTGDEQLAATMGVSIYGDVGQDFKERLQGELNKALESVDASAMTDELRKAFSTQNFSVILANLDKFPEEWQKRLKEMAASSEKFQADRAKDLLKSLEKFKSYGERQVELSKQTARRTADIQSMKISDTAKENLLEQNARKQAEESAKIAYEAFRDTPMYIELFDDLDAASGQMLENMRKNLEDMRENWKALSPRELKELQSKINDLDEQIARKNPFKALVASIKEYRDLQKVTSRSEAESAAIGANDKMIYEKEILEQYQKQYQEIVAKYGIESKEAKQAAEDLEVQSTITDLAIEEAKAAQKTASAFKEAGTHIQKAAEELQNWAGYVTDSLDGIGQIVSTFASDDVSETFDIIAEGIGKTVGGASELAMGLGKILTGTDIAGGIVDVIKGTGDFIAGTFGTKSQLSIKAINKKIDEQDRLLSQLSYSYGRLESAMAKAFGSDYIYNYTEQLKNLQAQQAAYEEQARLEDQKGKKKDEQKIEEYIQSAKEVEDQIIDMQGQLSEFFAGSDLTSAAEDFANSWIEAYMEFGSTTDAMKEKFQDMVNNMIVKSLAGKAMQNLLRPIFDEIDNLAIDGELTAAEIGKISAMATAAIPQINDAMTGLMNNLTTAGIDLRTHAGQFTGISRDIAGASEESILGLAAAVNTANFYISHVPAIAENVAAIRGALVGDTPANVRTTASEGPSYEDQMLGLVGSIPQMRDDMAAMRSMLEKVIKPVGVSATHYVAVR